PTCSTLFPYTTLFRSWREQGGQLRLELARSRLLDEPAILWMEEGRLFPSRHFGRKQRAFARQRRHCVERLPFPHTEVVGNPTRGDRKSTRLNSSHRTI